jgi:peroxisomal 3,2-trans-enoyl-CoA isomerase
MSTELPSFRYVKVELLEDGAVGIVRYNRPRSGNSLHPVLVQETLAAFQWMEEHERVAVIIHTGEGKFYCTGMELLEHKTEKAMSFALGSDFHMLNKHLISSQKVLIAAVNGPAAGYGVSSLALYDLVYCIPEAYFFTPFVKWGMAAEGASSYSFPAMMGHQKAAALFLAGDRISADEAQTLGLVTKVLDSNAFIDRVVDIACRIAKSPRGALMATKALMRAPVIQQLHKANDRECDLIHRERFESAEYFDAIQTFKIEQEMKKRSKVKL